MSEADDFSYRCTSDVDIACAESCVGLDACQDCTCATVALEAGGPWGEVMDVLFCLLPIIYLIVVTVKPKPVPTTVSLPTSAILMFLVRTMYLASDPLLTSASILLGLHEAMTPLSIMAGAITLFETMEATCCMPFMMREMKSLTNGHPVAECMVIFAFAYMIEGASGFGTPAALAAPMLVSTGHDPMKSVVTVLVMNTFATVWGAVGTPIWFGFGSLYPQEEQEQAFVEISYKAGICLAICAYCLLPFLLRIICPWHLVKQNLLFVYLSLTTVIAPSLGLAFVTEAFPSLIGGMVGLVGTAVLVKFKVGLSDLEEDDVEGDPLEIGSVSEHSLAYRAKTAESLIVGDIRSQKKNPKKLNQNSSSISGGSMIDRVTPSPRPIEPIAEQQEIYDSEFGDGCAEENGGGGGYKAEVKETTTTHNEASSTEESGRIAADTPLELVQSSQHEVLEHYLGKRKTFQEGYIRELLGRTSPIWLVVLILILTRVEQIGLKQYLTLTEPNFTIHFGTYGTFQLSASLVLRLSNILTYPGLNWKYELLYIPFFMPFVLVSLFTMVVYRKDVERTPKDIAAVVIQRLTNPAIALLGALCLVQLLVKVDTAAPAYILGTVLSKWFQEGFIVITPLLGALGSFFSGSTTVSNLTFGTIQLLAAESIGISDTAILALQVVGASAGNGICLNNIIAACAVVGLNIGEGAILKQTYKFVLGITTISTLVMLAFFVRF